MHLELPDGMKRVRSGGDFTKQEKEKEVVLLSQKKSLEEVVTTLKKNAANIEDSNIDKYMKLIDTTISTASVVLQYDGSPKVNIDIIKDTQNQTKELLSAEQVNQLDELNQLSEKISKVIIQPLVTSPLDNNIDSEINSLDAYEKDRYLKLKHEITRKLQDYISKLDKV